MEPVATIEEDDGDKHPYTHPAVWSHLNARMARLDFPCSTARPAAIPGRIYCRTTPQ